jgi:beta-xylosidase
VKPRLLAAAGVALVLAGVGARAQEVKSVFAGADPSALYAEGQLWIEPTGHGDTLESWSSADRTHFRKRGVLLGLADIGWARDDHARAHYLWAPDLRAANGKYYLYYAIGPQNPTPSRLGVAICDTPAGPCRDSGRPLLTGGDGFEAIDPMMFVDPKTHRALLYAGGSAGARLRVFELAPDLVSIAQEIPVDQPPLFTEGAFMHERNGLYYLSYSNGHWNRADYSVHYATAASPTGPWRYRGAILVGDRKYKGPGHHAFIRDPATGAWLIVYHRWEGKAGNGPYSDDRRVAIQPIRYDRSGRIVPVRMTR